MNAVHGVEQRRGTGTDGAHSVWPQVALAGLSAATMAGVVFMVFRYAPREAVMGDVQRIFYFHVASAWVGFAAFLVTAVGGLLYLVRQEPRWDALSLASAEIGLGFITMALVSGALWARPVWGTYWTWEPRLTISAVQWLAYLAYLMLRRSLDDRERAARFAGVYAIVAFVTVPLSWYAIRWWRTIHPDIVTGSGGMGLAPRMVETLWASLAAFSLLYLNLLLARMRLEQSRDALLELRGQQDTVERLLADSQRMGDEDV